MTWGFVGAVPSKALHQTGAVHVHVPVLTLGMLVSARAFSHFLACTALNTLAFPPCVLILAKRPTAAGP